MKIKFKLKGKAYAWKPFDNFIFRTVVVFAFVCLVSFLGM